MSSSPTSPRATARIRIRPPVKIPAQGHQRTRSVSLSPQPGSERAQARHGASKSVVLAKRRQSSIAYYTPSSPSPRSHQPNSADVGKESASHRSSLVLSSQSPSARDSVSSLDGPSLARERTHLTLVEKHADLLHFIAQKERKCLELRDQLATHEAELAELKRKWERIVHRGHDSLSTQLTTAGIGGVALDGLKEGVRIIAAGFSDISGTIHEFESSDRDKPTPLIYSPRENQSAHAKRTGSGHPSMSSMSSIQESVSLHDVLERTEGETVATAATLSRAGSLDYRIHKRTSRALFAKELSTPPGVLALPADSQGPESTNLDVGMSLVLAPSPTLVPPSASAKSASKSPVHGPIQGLPSPPTSPGSMSSWMDTMSKRLSGLQNGSTFSKSQRRASSLLAGVSNTLVSALTPGPTPTTPAPLPTLSSSTPRTVSSKLPPSPSRMSRQSSQATTQSASSRLLHSESHKTTTTNWDWLDDEEEHGGQVSADGIADPKPPPVPAPPAVSSFDDDDWNW